MESGTDRTCVVTPRLPEWFRVRSPREILHRLANGDPLLLRARAGSFLERHAYLLEGDALFLRTIAVIAHAGPRCRSAADADAWIEERMHEAVQELLQEPVRYPPEGGVYEHIGRPLGLDPCAMRRVAARFNRMEEADRQAFFRLVIRGQRMETLVAECGESAPELGRRARSVLDLFLDPAAALTRPECVCEL
jgi:hypothetical protein